MRPSPAHLHPSFSSRGAWVLALVLAASAAAQAPLAKKAAKAAPPPPDTTPLARYVPKDDLVSYFEFSGLDGHAVAWRKTAAYRMLNETPLGAMLEDLGTQLADKALALRPARKLSGAEVVTIVKHMAHSGFAFGVCSAPRKPEDGVAMMVIRGAARREARGPFGRLIGSFAGAAGKPQVVKMGGERSVVIMPGATPKESWAWWSEKNDLVFATQPSSGTDKRGAEQVIEVLDRKRPSAVEHPIHVELAKAKGPFQPIGLGFQVSLELPAAAADMKTSLDRLGLRGVRRLEYQWGLEGDSLMSIARVVATRPRQGLLGLYDQPTFEKTALPPLPEGITGFRVVSLDLPKTLDTLLAVAKSLGGPLDSLAQHVVELFKEKTGLDLRKDLLAHLGPKMAFYLAQDKEEEEVTTPEGADAGGALGGLAGGFNLKSVMAAAIKVPKFTLVAEVKDAAAVGRAVDQLMVQVNKGLREWRTEELDREEEAKEAAAAGPGAPKTKKSARAPGGGSRRTSKTSAPEFRLMTGETKAFVLNMPSDMPRLPEGIRPTIRLGAKHIVVSVSPESAKQALEEKVGAWTPPADLVSVFDRLPSSLVSLSISDPRPTLPASLASLPATLQKAINTVLVLLPAGRMSAPTPTDAANSPSPSTPSGPSGRGRREFEAPGFAPPAPFGAAPNDTKEPVTITLQVDPAAMPSPDALKALLFPGSSTVSVDDQSIQFIRREAFPDIGLTSPALLLGVALPAIQAARRAAVKAGAQSTAPNPGASPPPAGAPAATPSRRPINPK